MARTVIGDWEAPRDNNQYREQNIESVITVTTPDPAGVGGLARQAAAVARQNGLLVGMINGGGATVARSDTEWIHQSHLHIRAPRASSVHLDHVLIETLDKSPTRTLPESDPNTLSGLVIFYSQH